MSNEYLKRWTKVESPMIHKAVNFDGQPIVWLTGIGWDENSDCVWGICDAFFFDDQNGVWFWGDGNSDPCESLSEARESNKRTNKHLALDSAEDCPNWAEYTLDYLGEMQAVLSVGSILDIVDAINNK